MSTTVTDRNRFDRDDLIYLLDQVPAATVDYGEWLSIGAGLKEAGCTLADWSAWSATDTDRYNSSEMAAKWESFAGNNASGARADAETVARICFKHNAKEKDLPLVPSRANEYRPRTFQPSTAPATAGVAAPTPVAPAPVVEKPAEPEPDYSEGRKQHRAIIDRAVAAMTEGCDGWNYLTRRGLTAETIRAHRIGWNPRTRAVVMPYSTEEGEYYHINRFIDLGTHDDDKYKKPTTKTVGAEPIFCPQDLENTPVVFVVEGGFDVYALHQLGYKAAGIISANSYGRIAAKLKEDGYEGTVVVMLDDDKTGNKAAANFCKKLEEDGISYIRGTQTPGTNDASEALETCPDRFRAHIERLYLQARTGTDALRIADISETVAKIYAGEDLPPRIPTGLQSVDKALGGGFRAGDLVTLGAVSSVGKTTLALQMADSIAEGGRGVVFVTIEQSARELVAKSLARVTATAPGNRGLAATASEIEDPDRRAAWSAGESERLVQACEIYTGRVAPRLTILEGIEQPSVSDVYALARSIAERDGEPPVVFIDYLQLLAAPDARDDDKRATDKNVMGLRHLARDLKTPVIVISSLNRASYSAGVTLDAFKESGAIEYGSDVLLGLQPAGMYDQTEEVAETKAKGKARRIMREHKAKAQRPCELVVLKNRSGATTDAGIPLTFDAPHSLWVEPQPKAPTRSSDVPW